jgi:pimeloyl-ACP methyl ester carboxylesterase
MPETMREVTGDGGVRLAVRDLRGPAAGAPTLLMHHGLASSQRIWDLVLPRLTTHHRAVTYDARGHGRSAKPSSGYGFDRTVADLLAVARGRRAGRPVLVGHSWGAMVALEAAAAHPRAFAGVVLVDGGVTPMRESFPSWSAAKEALAPPHLAGMPVEEFRGLMRTFLAEALEVTPDIEDIVLSVMRVDRQGRIRPRLSRANHFRILHAIWRQDPLGLHARLRVPTLAILAHRPGHDDDWARAKREAARRLRETGTPTRISWIEGIHDVPLQHPDALASSIRRFSRSAVR